MKPKREQGSSGRCQYLHNLKYIILASLYSYIPFFIIIYCVTLITCLCKQVDCGGRVAFMLLEYPPISEGDKH